MKSKKVTPLEALRIFYISNELLGSIFKIPQKHMKNKLPKAVKEIVKKSKKLSLKELSKYDFGAYHKKADARYEGYLNSTWKLEEIDLKDCGAWPRMGGLPDVATKGSILDTVNFIKPYLEDKNKLTLRTSRVLYIEEMMKYADKIVKYIPIIVMKGGVIRNKLRRASLRKGYKKCKYDIDDGNHRVLAYGMLGNTKIQALVGTRTGKKNFLK